MLYLGGTDAANLLTAQLAFDHIFNSVGASILDIGGDIKKNVHWQSQTRTKGWEPYSLSVSADSLGGLSILTNDSPTDKNDIL